jgi:hypothetical protein
MVKGGGSGSIIHLLILNRHQTGVGGQEHAPADLPPGQSPSTYFTRGWVIPRPVGTAGYGEEKTSCLHPGLKPGPSSP